MSANANDVPLIFSDTEIISHKQIDFRRKQWQLQLTLLWKKGSTGSEVEQLQVMLNEIYGSVLTVDGIFGNKTESLVKQYQEDNHLVVDGIVGKLTWNSLENRFKKH